MHLQLSACCWCAAAELLPLALGVSPPLRPLTLRSSMAALTGDAAVKSGMGGGAESALLTTSPMAAAWLPGGPAGRRVRGG